MKLTRFFETCHVVLQGAKGRATESIFRFTSSPSAAVASSLHYITFLICQLNLCIKASHKRITTCQKETIPFLKGMSSAEGGRKWCRTSALHQQSQNIVDVVNRLITHQKANSSAEGGNKTASQKNPHKNASGLLTSTTWLLAVVSNLLHESSMFCCMLCQACLHF